MKFLASEKQNDLFGRSFRSLVTVLVETFTPNFQELLQTFLSQSVVHPLTFSVSISAVRLCREGFLIVEQNVIFLGITFE